MPAAMAENIKNSRSGTVAGGAGIFAFGSSQRASPVSPACDTHNKSGFLFNYRSLSNIGVNIQDIYDEFC